MKKLISNDFDGLIYDLDYVHKLFIKKVYGVEYNTIDATHWEYLYENYPKIVECWINWDLYKEAPFIDGGIEFIETQKRIYGADAIQIVASSPESIQEPKTTIIIEKLGIDVIHVTKENKSKYTKGTILIDDGAYNIRDHLKNTTDSAILFDLNGEYGWNKDFYECERAIRATNYQEALSWLAQKI